MSLRSFATYRETGVSTDRKERKSTMRNKIRASGWLFAFTLLVVGAPSAFGWGLSRIVWVHPSKPQSEFQRDYNQCQQKAAQNASNWGMKGNIFSIASDTNQCLTDMGWQRVK